MLVVRPVVDLSAVPPLTDEVEVAEDAHVVGDGRLTHPDRGRELVHAELAGLDESLPRGRHAGRIAQHLEEVGDLAGLARLQQPLSDGADALGVDHDDVATVELVDLIPSADSCLFDHGFS